MNEFEKKLIADLASGKSAEALLAEFNTALVTAKKVEEERQKKLAEEKRLKEEEARRAKAVKEREVKSKQIVDLANRALNDSTTAEDVAWLMNEYVNNKYPKYAEELGEVISAKDVESMMNLAVKLMDTAETMFGGTWSSVANQKGDKVFFTKPNNVKSKSDDEVINDFINKILH
jgi:hypothetical protein